eukprot:gene162-388_t
MGAVEAGKGGSGRSEVESGQDSSQLLNIIQQQMISIQGLVQQQGASLEGKSEPTPPTDEGGGRNVVRMMRNLSRAREDAYHSTALHPPEIRVWADLDVPEADLDGLFEGSSPAKPGGDACKGAGAGTRVGAEGDKHPGMHLSDKQREAGRACARDWVFARRARPAFERFLRLRGWKSFVFFMILAGWLATEIFLQIGVEAVRAHPLVVIAQEDERRTGKPVRGFLSADLAKGFLQMILSKRLASVLPWLGPAQKVYSPLRMYLGLSWAPIYFTSCTETTFGTATVPTQIPEEGLAGILRAIEQSACPDDPGQADPSLEELLQQQAAALTAEFGHEYDPCLESGGHYIRFVDGDHDPESVYLIRCGNGVDEHMGRAYPRLVEARRGDSAYRRVTPGGKCIFEGPPGLRTYVDPVWAPGQGSGWVDNKNPTGEWLKALRQLCDGVPEIGEGPGPFDAPEACEVELELSGLAEGMRPLKRAPGEEMLRPYVDDVNGLFSRSWQLILALGSLMHESGVTGLAFSVQKLQIKSSLSILGWILDAEEMGRRVCPERAAGIRNIQMPRSSKELKSFLATCSYVREAILGYSVKAAVLVKYLTNAKGLSTDPEAVAAFEAMKADLSEAVAICEPDFQAARKGGEHSLRFMIDASMRQVSVIGLQLQNGRDRLIWSSNKRFSAEAMLTNAATALNYEVGGLTHFVRDVLPVFPRAPILLYHDAQGLGEADFQALLTNSSLLRSIRVRLDEINEALAKSVVRRIHMSGVSNFLADYGSHSGDSVPLESGETFDDFKNKVKGLFFPSGAFGGAAGDPADGSKAPTPEASGAATNDKASGNLFSGEEHGSVTLAMVGRHEYLHRVAGLCVAAETFRSSRSILQPGVPARHLVQVKGVVDRDVGVPGTTEVYSVEVVFGTSLVVIEPMHPLIKTRAELEQGFEVVATTVEGKTRRVTPAVTIRRTTGGSEKVVSAIAIITQIGGLEESGIQQASSRALRSSRPGNLRDRVLWGRHLALSVDDWDGVQAEIAERRQKMEAKVSDEEHFYNVCDHMQRECDAYGMSEPLGWWVTKFMGCGSHLLWGPGRPFPTCRIAKAFHRLKRVAKYPVGRNIKVSAELQVIMLFLLKEACAEGQLDSYSRLLFGIPLCLTTIFLCPRARSLLGRLVADAVGVNTIFQAATWCMSTSADVWHKLLSLMNEKREQSETIAAAHHRQAQADVADGHAWTRDVPPVDPVEDRDRDILPGATGTGSRATSASGGLRGSPDQETKVDLGEEDVGCAPFECPHVPTETPVSGSDGRGDVGVHPECPHTPSLSKGCPDRRVGAPTSGSMEDLLWGELLQAGSGQYQQICKKPFRELSKGETLRVQVRRQADSRGDNFVVTATVGGEKPWTKWVKRVAGDISLNAARIRDFLDTVMTGRVGGLDHKTIVESSTKGYRVYRVVPTLTELQAMEKGEDASFHKSVTLGGETRCVRSPCTYSVTAWRGPAYEEHVCACGGFREGPLVGPDPSVVEPRVPRSEVMEAIEDILRQYVGLAGDERPSIWDTVADAESVGLARDLFRTTKELYRTDCPLSHLHYGCVSVRVLYGPLEGVLELSTTAFRIYSGTLTPSTLKDFEGGALNLWPVVGSSWHIGDALGKNRVSLILCKGWEDTLVLDPKILGALFETQKVEFGPEIVARKCLDEDADIEESFKQIRKALGKAGRKANQKGLRGILEEARSYDLRADGLLFRTILAHRYVVLTSRPTALLRGISVVQHLVAEAHEVGHAGCAAVSAEIMRKGFWSPSLMAVARSVHLRCLKCAVVRKPAEVGVCRRVFSESRPGVELYIDWVTGLPPSSKGNTTLLTINDGRSGKPFYFPAKNCTTKTTVEGMESAYISSGESWQFIRSDNGTHFAKEFEVMLAAVVERLRPGLQLRFQRGPAYAPEAQAAVEGPHAGFNRGVLIGLGFATEDFVHKDEGGFRVSLYKGATDGTRSRKKRKPEDEYHPEDFDSLNLGTLDWESRLPQILHVMCETPREAYGFYTTNELYLGRRSAPLVGQNRYEETISTAVLDDVARANVCRREAELFRLQNKLKRNLRAQKAEGEKVYHIRDFQVGSIVLRKREGTRKCKFTPYCYRSLWVVARVYNTSVDLERADGRKSNAINPVSAHFLVPVVISEGAVDAYFAGLGLSAEAKAKAWGKLKEYKFGEGTTLMRAKRALLSSPRAVLGPDDFDPPSLHVVSWNVDGMMALMKKRPEALQTLHKVLASRPRLVFVQEIKAAPTKLDKITRLLRGLDPSYEWHWNPSTTRLGYAGTAVGVHLHISKEVEVSALWLTVEGEDDDTGDANEEGRLQLIRDNQRNTTYVNVYSVNAMRGLKRLDYRCRWDAALGSALKSLQDTYPGPFFCIGDFNALKNQSADEIHHQVLKGAEDIPSLTIEEMDSFGKMVDGSGLRALQLTGTNHARDCAYTMYGSRFEVRKGQGFVLDHILHNGPAGQGNAGRLPWTRLTADCRTLREPAQPGFDASVVVTGRHDHQVIELRFEGVRAPPVSPAELELRVPYTRMVGMYKGSGSVAPPPAKESGGQALRRLPAVQEDAEVVINWGGIGLPGGDMPDQTVEASDQEGVNEADGREVVAPVAPLSPRVRHVKLSKRLDPGASGQAAGPGWTYSKGAPAPYRLWGTEIRGAGFCIHTGVTARSASEVYFPQAGEIEISSQVEAGFSYNPAVPCRIRELCVGMPELDL